MFSLYAKLIMFVLICSEIGSAVVSFHELDQGTLLMN